MRVDLHVHTQESDGLLSVEEVVNLAYDKNVQTLAITDHESTEGVAKAEILAKGLNIKIIPGVELLTNYQGHEVHLLGYFKDVNHPLLQARLREIREQRTALAYEMVECLNNDGLSLRWQDVEREVYSEGAVSKGHIMRAIYHHESSHSQPNWREIAQYFRPGGVAYLPYQKHAFEDAVDLILACGGFPVVAHPGLLFDPKIIFSLLAYRPIGLEVYYGYWERQNTLIPYYAEIADKFAILATGGSDYHGPFGQIQLGQMDVPIEGVLKLQTYLTL
ncbi:PHP domain-containing protein [Desulfosporosinus sp. BG]|uniref:PHP domain-containing protein n=1 Tax=Desulfosporosinus sp. BG TaxID=1633135 RepID=UPI00083B694A|nr:PHP domain-containing protein [Desulfosporosinus sp. BG]ODA42847.1 putative metal-dependent phosphoesterases (PHP family) [Desulfosporosinus sp. BG]